MAFTCCNHNWFDVNESTSIVASSIELLVGASDRKNNQPSVCPPLFHRETHCMILTGILMPLFCVCGLLSNGISSFYFVKRYLSLAAFRFYVYALCFADSILLISSFFILTLPLWTYKFNWRKGYESWTDKAFLIWNPVGLAAHSASVWLVVAITGIRYLSIQFPFFFHSSGQNGIAKVVIPFIFVVACVYNSPRIWEHKLDECFDIDQNATISQASRTWLDESNAYMLWYQCVSYTLLLFALPLTTLLCCNFLIAKRLFRSIRGVAKKHVEHPGESRAEAAEENLRFTSSLCLSIGFVFLFCHSVAFCLNIIDLILFSNNHSTVFPGVTRATTLKIYDILTDVANVLVVLNSSFNCFIYLMFSQRFRKNIGTSPHLAATKETRREKREGSYETSFIHTPGLTSAVTGSQTELPSRKNSGFLLSDQPANCQPTNMWLSVTK